MLSGMLRGNLPLIQAPMAGVSTPAMAAAVARGGAIGSIATAYVSPKDVKKQIKEFRLQAPARAPVNVNMFAHLSPPPDPSRDDRVFATLSRYYEELGVERPAAVDGADTGVLTPELVDAVLEARPEIVSFHFGLPSADVVDRFKFYGAVVMSTATTVREAEHLEARGVDVIIAQGFEAGGHRGTFLEDGSDNRIGLFALLPQIVDAVSVPVVAAGGICDGRGVAAAFTLGASGVQLGTAFVCSAESGASAAYRRRLRSAHLSRDTTRVTCAYTGRPARSIDTKYTREMDGNAAISTSDFPLIKSYVKPLNAAASRRGNLDFTPCWAGQALALAGAGAGESCEEIVRTLVKNAHLLAPGVTPTPRWTM